MLGPLGALLVAHMVADYPLQTEWVATNKHDEIPALVAHSVDHAGVALLLLIWIGVSLDVAFPTAGAVFVTHGVIDSLDLHIRWDQTAHLLTTVALGGVLL